MTKKHASLLILTLVTAFLPGCKPADTDAPQITVRQGLPAFIALGDTLPEPIIEVIDNRDCRLESALISDGTVNTARYGDYRVDYRVQDEAGNESAVGFDVRVGMLKDNYYAVEYRATDTCTSGIFSYLAGIQDCTCPENKAQLFNLGNFGPGAYVNMNIEGDYGQLLDIERTTGSLTWSGSGLTVPTGDTLHLDWQIDNGSFVEQCRTVLIRNSTP